MHPGEVGDEVRRLNWMTLTDVGAIDAHIVALMTALDTDLQWALWDGIRGFEEQHHDYLQGQLGNPSGADAPNKKYYDPRVWLRAAEVSFVARLEQAFAELGNVNTLG